MINGEKMFKAVLFYFIFFTEWVVAQVQIVLNAIYLTT